MTNIDYSVIIRTIGKAGKKYQKLLDSIENSNAKPKEIIVVLPEGYSLPKEKTGYERFVFCKKGMVTQRLVGIENCHTKYALIIDDDIEFDESFVCKVAKPVLDERSGISAGPLLSFFPAKGMISFVSIICGLAVPTFFHKNRYNTVLKTTGYSYNRNIEIGKDRIYETQSAAWTCFFADIDRLKGIHFEDEIWLEKNGYSTHDDTAMFYKAWINGLNPVIVADAEYNHLDAGTSRKKNEIERAYSTSFNTYVFWRRFIYEQASFLGKIWSKVCIAHLFFIQTVISLIKCIMNKENKKLFSSSLKGKKAAKKWIKTDDYLRLPTIRRN